MASNIFPELAGQSFNFSAVDERGQVRASSRALGLRKAITGRGSSLEIASYLKSLVMHYPL